MLSSPTTFHNNKGSIMRLSLRQRGLLLFALCSLPLLVLSGCSGGKGKKANVTGTVTYNNKPLPRGKITFVPSGKGTPVTGVIEDGKFDVKGAPVGECKVLIDTRYLLQSRERLQTLERQFNLAQTMVAKGQANAEMKAELEKNKDEIKELREEVSKYVQIPDTYLEKEKTPLSMDVQGGELSPIEIKPGK